MLHLIVACTFEGLIGKNNQMPWHIKEELKKFAKLTQGANIVMGRKTFESLPGILANRKHIILTHDLNYQIESNANVKICHNSKEVIDNFFQNPKRDCWVIGGSEIIKIFLDTCDAIHVSWILQHYDGDIYLPKINWKNFTLSNEEKHLEFIYRIYKRKK